MTDYSRLGIGSLLGECVRSNGRWSAVSSGDGPVPSRPIHMSPLTPLATTRETLT